MNPGALLDKTENILGIWGSARNSQKAGSSLTSSVVSAQAQPIKRDAASIYEVGSRHQRFLGKPKTSTPCNRWKRAHSDGDRAVQT